MKPRISVVVCTKNEEKYIGECLEHLKSQELKPEIIVVDAHSTDKTLDIAKKYTNKIVFDDKTGLSAARNIGWKNATSDIVAFCDADSKPSKQWTKNIIELLQKYDAVSGPFLSYDGGFKQKTGLKLWADLAPRIGSLFGYNSIWGANMAFRKAVLEKEPFKVKFLEDYEIGRRLRMKKYKVKFSKKITIEASSRRFSKGFYRVCFKEYIPNAMRINKGKEPTTDYWK